MMKKIFLLFLITLSFSGLRAQNNEWQNKNYIEVSGTSETEVVPDEIFLTITLMERMDGKDKITIDKQEAELKKHLKELNIEIANLTLNSADADYRKIRSFKKDVLVAKSYLLKVNNAETISKVYERLDKMNAHDAYISKFTHSKILELQKENRIKALQAAKAKAEYLLTSIGEKPLQAMQIVETENYVQDIPQVPGRMYRNAVQSFDSVRESSEEEISFKKIRIRNAFMVKYEIQKK